MLEREGALGHGGRPDLPQHLGGGVVPKEGYPMEAEVEKPDLSWCWSRREFWKSLR